MGDEKRSKGRGKNAILAAVLRVPGFGQRELAELAEVSQSSVSSMLRCDERMRPRTRALIGRAVAELVKDGLRYRAAAKAEPADNRPVLTVAQWETPAAETHDMETHDPEALQWRPQYWHEPTAEFVDLGPSMALDEALAMAAARADDTGGKTRVRGPVELVYAAAAESAGSEDAAADEGAA